MKDRAFYRNEKWASLAADELGADEFAPEEAAQIKRLRLQFALYPYTYQLGIDLRRLLFACWLVQHGYIGEGVDERACAPQEEKVGQW